MKKHEIERFVLERVKRACEDGIRDAIAALNAEGHAFAPCDDWLCEFREPGSDWSLQVHAGVSVMAAKASGIEATPASATDDAWAALEADANAGEPVARQLLALEADVANGGFDQLHLNKGIDFIDACATTLATLGAKKTLKLVDEARALFHANADLEPRLVALRDALAKIDRRYGRRSEDLAALYIAWRGRGA